MIARQKKMLGIEAYEARTPKRNMPKRRSDIHSASVYLQRDAHAEELWLIVVVTFGEVRSSLSDLILWW